MYILLFLHFFHYLRKKYGEGKIDIDKIPSTFTLLKKDFNYYQMLYNQAINDKIRIVALRGVIREFRKYPPILNFIEEFCYHEDLKSDNDPQKTKKITELIDAYFKEYEVGGKTYKAPIDVSTMTVSQQYAAAKHATFMAEATYIGCHFLTTYSGLVLDKSVRPYTRRTKHAIFNINKAHGYCYKLPRGRDIVPEPMLIGDIGAIINGNQTLFTPELSKGIHKGELEI